MKVIHKNQTKKLKHSDICTSIEYPLGDKDINGAIIKLKGRYPDKGRVVNLKCKELAYIIKGSGKVVVEGQEVKLSKEDMVLIDPGEKYYWEGKMIIFMPCTPAWSSEQHEEVE